VDGTLSQTLAEFGAVTGFAVITMSVLVRTLKDSREERDAMRAEMRSDRERNLDAIAKLTDTLTDIRAALQYTKKDPTR